MHFVAETCSHVESRDASSIITQVDGGGSNGMGFASGWWGGAVEISRWPLKMLGMNPWGYHFGSGRLPHQPYLKMQDFQVPSGVSPWFHKVVWGVIWQWEPGGWDSVDLRGRGDIVRTQDWPKRPAQAICCLPNLSLLRTLTFNYDYY